MSARALRAPAWRLGAEDVDVWCVCRIDMHGDAYDVERYDTEEAARKDYDEDDSESCAVVLERRNYAMTCDTWNVVATRGYERALKLGGWK